MSPKRVSVRFSERIQELAPSGTRAVADKVALLRYQGIDVINFSGGEPDGDSAPHVKNAAFQAIEDGMTRHAATGGVTNLKQAICFKLKRDHALTYVPCEVMATVAGKHALFNAFAALVDPGDEVLIPKPLWVSYPEQVKLSGGVPVIAPTREPARSVSRFALDPFLNNQLQKLGTLIRRIASAFHQRLQPLPCPPRCGYPLRRGTSSLRPARLVGSPIRRGCTPTLFPAALGIHPVSSNRLVGHVRTLQP